MMKTNGNTRNDERGLLPYPVIIAANKGDPEAMKVVVQQIGRASCRERV